MAGRSDTKLCLWCAEKIAKQAKVCKHCDRSQNPVWNTVRSSAPAFAFVGVIFSAFTYITTQVVTLLDLRSEPMIELLDYDSNAMVVARNSGKVDVFFHSISAKIVGELYLSTRFGVSENIKVGDTLKFELSNDPEGTCGSEYSTVHGKTGKDVFSTFFEDPMSSDMNLTFVHPWNRNLITRAEAVVMPSLDRQNSLSLSSAFETTRRSLYRVVAFKRAACEIEYSRDNSTKRLSAVWPCVAILTQCKQRSEVSSPEQKPMGE